MLREILKGGGVMGVNQIIILSEHFQLTVSFKTLMIGLASGSSTTFPFALLQLVA